MRTNTEVKPYPAGSAGNVVEVAGERKPFNIVKMDMDDDLGYYEDCELDLIGPGED